MKSYLQLLTLLLMLLPVLGCSKDTEAPTVSTTQTTRLPPDIENALTRKSESLLKVLQSHSIKEALRTANEMNKSLSSVAIEELDQRWRESKGYDPIIKEYLSRKCAYTLRNFIKADNSFAEIFVTDIRGLNVCQSNKTTDLYQADEYWWVKTYNHGRGKTHYGHIEYDDSSGATGIAYYLPLFAEKSGKIIGIGKAIVTIQSIKSEL